MLTKKVLSTISLNSMLDEGDRVLVAVSGGVDSVVLLDVLCQLAPIYKLELFLSHLDHQLRGEDSRADARFVSQLASRLGIELVSESVDVSAIARNKKLGIEEAARMVRLRFLRETAIDLKSDKIAVGHTANDLAETILFNLIRGSGLTGIGGIKPVSLPFIRPLIDVTRDEIVSYANQKGIAWRYDRSNADTRFTRNLIRHQIIPVLESLNPRFVIAMSRTAEIVRDQNQALHDLLDPLLQDAIIEESKHSICLNRNYLKSCSPGVLRALLRQALEKVRGNLQGISKENIDDLCNLIKSSRSHGELHLLHAQARLQEDELALSQPEPGRIPRQDRQETEVPLGSTNFPAFGIGLDIEISPWNRQIDVLNTRDANTEIIDADKVSFPLKLRNRRPGDRFSPLGLSATKKLKDFFIDSHVPFYERDKVPLLCDQRGIILVIGQRISDTVRVDTTTRRVIVIRWEEIE
jgi:tRNA(Ile)-lysidine synthase